MACSFYYKFESEVKKQKEIDNPERFLGVGVNQGVNQVNQEMNIPSSAERENGANIEQETLDKDTSQTLPHNEQEVKPNIDVNTLALLLTLLVKVVKEKGNKAKPEDFINILESVLENSDEQEKK